MMKKWAGMCSSWLSRRSTCTCCTSVWCTDVSCRSMARPTTSASHLWPRPGMMILDHLARRCLRSAHEQTQQRAEGCIRALLHPSKADKLVETMKLNEAFDGNSRRQGRSSTKSPSSTAHSLSASCSRQRSRASSFSALTSTALFDTYDSELSSASVANLTAGNTSALLNATVELTGCRAPQPVV